MQLINGYAKNHCFNTNCLCCDIIESPTGKYENCVSYLDKVEHEQSIKFKSKSIKFIY